MKKGYIQKNIAGKYIWMSTQQNIKRKYVMNGNKLLLDTNIVLYMFGGDITLAEVLGGKSIYLSFVTELQLLGYKDLSKKEQASIEQFLADCTIIDINKEIKNKAIEFRKASNLKLPDAIIAATAAFLKLPLMTADADFATV